MERKQTRLIILPLIMIMAIMGMVVSADCAEYFVGNNGNDAYPGTMTHPWKTLAHATTQLKHNNTLTLLNGSTWNEQLKLDGKNNITVQGAVGNGGRPIISGQGITLGSTEGLVDMAFCESARIRNIAVEASPRYGMRIRSCNNSMIEGCHITNSAADGLYFRDSGAVKIRENEIRDNTGDGVFLLRVANNSIVEKNHFKNNSYNMGSGSQIDLDRCSEVDIRYNFFTGPASPENSTRGLRVYDNENLGLRQETRDVKFYGNIVVNCYRGLDIVSRENGNTPFQQILILNNTISHCDTAFNMVGPFQTSRILNNISYCNGDHCSAALTSTGIEWDYNLWYSNGSSARACPVGTHDQKTDPEFHGVEGCDNNGGQSFHISDFSLTEGSPAIDKGKDLSDIFSVLMDCGDTVLPENCVTRKPCDEWDKGADIYCAEHQLEPPLIIIRSQ